MIIFNQSEASAVRETPKRGKTLQLLIHLLECTQTFWSKSKGSSSFANSIDRFLTCLAPYLRKGWMRIIWQRSILIQVKRESKLTYIIGVNGESNIVLTEWIEILTFCMHDCWLRSLPKETSYARSRRPWYQVKTFTMNTFTKKLKQQYNKYYYLVLLISKKNKQFQSGL